MLRALALMLCAQASAPAATAPSFTGSKACKGCHEPAFAQWQGSHHQLAMQPARPDTVLGDFAGKTFTHFGKTTRFELNDGRYEVVTDDVSGDPRRYRVTHTFGVYPLQQYLVDTGGGRRQALQVMWDSRPADTGGQRWYHLYPDEPIGANDELHWTGAHFNWNNSCAECHSTHVTVGYDPDKNQFDTRFSEVSVGCEACHGPGSTHVARASSGTLSAGSGLTVTTGQSVDAVWVMDPSTGIARRSPPAAPSKQVESCGRCHARRSPLTETYPGGDHLTDTHMPALLEENLYFADGRIQDEVYVYGSFLQSAMYQAGVTCSDCHNVHSATLRGEPNTVCAGCHLPDRFASIDHARSYQPDHKVAPGDCVSCHMPATTYMGVDDRRDHSFRLPDAGLRPDHYGQVLAAGRRGGANRALASLAVSTETPDIVRATATSLLRQPLDPRDGQTLVKLLDDTSPLVRLAAVRTLSVMPDQLRLYRGAHLLEDDSLAVRIAAARTYAADRSSIKSHYRKPFDQAAAELRTSLGIHLARPDNAISLAEFESRAGNPADAEKAYRHAVTVAPHLALPHHALGLHLVRQRQPAAALTALAKAAELDPDNPRFVYVYGVALNSTGKPQRALEVLGQAWRQFPGSYDIGWALATMQRDAGLRQSARATAASLAAAFPADHNVASLLTSLQP